MRSMIRNIALLASTLLVDPSLPVAAFSVSPLLRTKRAPQYYLFASSHPISDATTSSKGDVATNMTSPPMQVFIEDTDAYGIMYNSNYLRSYDRALHSTFLENSDSRNDKGHSPSSSVMSHEGWSICSMDLQKFVASPSLGEEFVIQGTLLPEPSSKDSPSIEKQIESWNMQMTSPDGAKVYNTIKNLRIASHRDADETNRPAAPSQVDVPPFDITDDVAQTTHDSFIIYRDEMDAHWSGHLPLRNVLNLFERSRTNMLGGPNCLRRMQQEDGIIVVVASISDCTVLDSDGDDEAPVCYPGQNVSVQSQFVVKRKGMILECYQTLLGDAEKNRLAQGKVTLMMLNSATGRPTSQLPSGLKSIFGLEDSDEL